MLGDIYLAFLYIMLALALSKTWQHLCCLLVTAASVYGGGVPIIAERVEIMRKPLRVAEVTLSAVAHMSIENLCTIGEV